jgi:hypothetical protein
MLKRLHCTSAAFFMQKGFETFLIREKKRQWRNEKITFLLHQTIKKIGQSIIKGV